MSISARPPSTAEVGAHEAAVTASLPDVVTSLRDTLGVGIVARLAGVTETRAVHQWAGGEREIRSAGVETRLRIAYQLVLLLSLRWAASVVATWFQVPNPLLAYRAPLDLLDAQAGADPSLSASSVVEAASRFVENPAAQDPKSSPVSPAGVASVHR